MKKIIGKARQQNALEYAIKRIRDTGIDRYVDRLILYGSCARGQEKYSSDIDLFLVLSQDFLEDDSCKDNLRLLQGTISSDNIDDPEADLRVVIGNSWESKTDIYHSDIRREGIDVWV